MSTNDATIVGNLTRPFELRFAPSGAAVANSSVAINYKKGDEEKVSFIEITAFASLAENCAETLDKGDRVIVSGRIQQDTWETDSGEKRSKVVLIAESVGVELRFATATIVRNEKTQ